MPIRVDAYQGLSSRMQCTYSEAILICCVRLRAPLAFAEFESDCAIVLAAIYFRDISDVKADLKKGLTDEHSGSQGKS